LALREPVLEDVIFGHIMPASHNSASSLSIFCLGKGIFCGIAIDVERLMSRDR
jgi:hypothetical protein